MKQDLKMVFDVLHKTIGFDLSQTKSMSDEEYAEWSKKQNEERKKWEEEHPEIVAKRKSWDEKVASKKPYTLTPEEREIVKEVLHTDDKGLDELTISIYNDGEISARTPDVSWKVLAGREWCINLKEKKSTLVCMN